MKGKTKKKDLKMGADAKLYRFDDAKRNYVDVTIDILVLSYETTEIFEVSA